jgi:hypothetical protein
VSDAGDGVLVGDGAVTTADLTLTVTVADCMPIFLYDRRRGVKGLLHSGWKGTGILAAAVGRLQREFNSSPESIDVTLGPCIGSCCYRVDEHRAALFAGLWGTEAIVRRNEGPYLDLRAANEAILRNIGVVNVQVVTNCTACDPAFGSFRRQGPSAYTHMLAWV